MEANELPEELMSIRHIKTYRVPPQYFDGLAEDILGKVHLPMVSDIPFSAPPAGYFDGLADGILQKIKGAQKSEVQQELEEIEPFLAGLSKANLYTVPQGYFETFAVPVETRREAAPVLPMSRRPKWITYAAAAVVTGVVAVSAVLFAGRDGGTSLSKNTQAALAKVSDNDLADYLDNAPSDGDAIPVSNTGTLSSGGLYKLLLNNVSDDDLQQYLNENNNSDETNSKGI